VEVDETGLIDGEAAAVSTGVVSDHEIAGHDNVREVERATLRYREAAAVTDRGVARDDAAGHDDVDRREVQCTALSNECAAAIPAGVVVRNNAAAVHVHVLGVERSVL